ncbi:MAG TPA: hypothetical protein P5218_04145 [Planctomycetota bacterium]|nr:hypothetical protein [Planctomycetota bacterium]
MRSWLALGLVLALGAGCGKAQPGASEPAASDAQPPQVASRPLPADLPEDTVLVIEDQPITRSEIDRWLGIYRLIEPAKSEHALRRLIVTNSCLPIAAARVLDPEGSAAALRRLERARTKVLAGETLSLEDPQIERIEDTWKSTMGLDRLGVGKETPLGEWSPIFETLGGYTMVRVVRAPSPWLPNSVITLEHITVNYLPPEQSKEIVWDALKNVEITVVDPEWRRYLPTIYLHQCRVPQ